MNEIQTVRTADIVGAEIRSLAYQAKCMTVLYGVEIGRRLVEAKELVGHGKWLDWLKTETEYSPSTASRLMRVYEEYGAAQIGVFGAEVNSSTLKNLSISNALRLLAVPEEERESFAEQVDAEHLSARELEQAIRERDEALKRAEELENDAEGAALARGELEDKLHQAEEKAEDLAMREKEALEKLNAAKEAVKELAAENKELRERPVDVAVMEPDPQAVSQAVDAALAEAGEKHKAEIDKLNKKLDARDKEKAKWEKQKAKLEEQLASADGEKERQRLSDKVEELEKRLAMAGVEITTFRLCFNAWQEDFNKLLAALADVPGPEERDKLRAAVRAVLEQQGGRV